ncbi:MAG: phenylalanine--tRNA ligase subunit beta [Kiritimatiellae bacterium]|nr:phenylalanine--tRNA ligase subunit beta [Kiritimatiellia bacterium]
MKLPLSWLNEYVKIDDIDPKELAEKLTRAGLQVEAIETVGEQPLDDHFVVAEIVECEPHPDSDHLHICKVNDGTETLQVVCGAPNARAGMKTAFSKIGAVIPNGGFKIKKGRMRGVDSFGMCCSSAELNLPGGNHDGIMEFPAETPTGAFLRDVLPGEKPETVFEVEVTWNRPDALSVIGLAREFGAILHREVKKPDVSFVECDVDVTSEVSVSVEDTEKCPRYTARVVTSVEDGPSPDWMAKRLELCGMRSLGLVVDVTNYVMLELGQPMHAFDHTKLKDRRIVVRCAREGETMKTLDGVDRKLDQTMLMICDSERPNAVAGIMGGEESEIAEGTKTVLLESALFEPTSTKATATKLGLASESSYRYIRGVDKDLADFASRRAAHLLQRLGNAKVARGVVDVDNRPTPLNADVTLNFERARRLIGIPVGNDAMVFILKALGLEPRTPAGTTLFAGVESIAFGIPSWRYDLTLEADLVEEVARIYGLDNIPDSMPSAPSVSSLSEAPFKAKAKIRETCLALGFTEAMHYSFLSQRELDDFDKRNAASRLVIPDPVSVEYGVMRDSLLPQMLGSLGRNASRQAESALLFEMGKVFSNGEKGPAEAERLSLGFFGPVGRESLRRRQAVTEEDAVLWMKGVVEELVRRLHVGRVEFTPAEHPAFTPGAALTVKVNGRDVGILGAVSAKLRHPYRLSTQMALCEVELKPFLKNVGATGRVSPVPQFPLVRRDVAIVASQGVKNADIENVIRKNGGKILTKVTLFDIFKPKGAAEAARSLAYSLEFRSPEKTLTDEEVGQAFRRVVDALKATGGIEVRES